MKKILVSILLALFVLTGCSTVPLEISNSRTKINYIGDEGIPELAEGFGVYGASVELDGVYPGWSGVIPLTIVNGQDRERTFVISLRSPVIPEEGYEVFPQSYYDWISISESEVTLPSGETYEIQFTFTMPKGKDYSDRKAEVRIRLDDITQTGLIQTAVESKWYITTAK